MADNKKELENKIKKTDLKGANKVANSILSAGHFSEFGSKKISTNFNNLDLCTNGLELGRVCVLLAESSIGKSTLALQLANQIAINDNKIMYFTLEQTIEEMVSKTVSCYVKTAYFNDDTPSAKEIRKMDLNSLDGDKPESIEWKIKDFIRKYEKEIGCNIVFSQPMFSLTVERIEEELLTYMESKNLKEAPLIFIDYLQLLDSSKNVSDKQMIAEHNIKYLKYIAMKYNTRITAISSVNRQSYRSPLTMGSIKDSGAYEYGADEVWALQLHALSNMQEGVTQLTQEEYSNARKGEKGIRQVDLISLKNRGGETDWNAQFEYFPKNDLFIPSRQTGKIVNNTSHIQTAKENAFDEIAKATPNLSNETKKELAKNFEASENEFIKHAFIKEE